MSSQQQISGNGNIGVQGNNNTIVSGLIPLLSKSDIADLLNVVKNIPGNAKNEESIRLPKGLVEKLRFNNVENWEKIFDDDCPNYDAVVKVMEDFPASSDIMSQLHTMFYKYKPKFEVEGKIQGDKLLTDLHEELCKEIQYSSENRNEVNGEVKFSNAVISSFVSSLLKRAVVVCKVLLVPDEN